MGDLGGLTVYLRTQRVEEALEVALVDAGFEIERPIAETPALVVPKAGSEDVFEYHPLDEIARVIERELFK